MLFRLLDFYLKVCVVDEGIRWILTLLNENLLSSFVLAK